MSRWSDRALRRLAWAGWWVVAIASVGGWVVTSIGKVDSPASWGSSLLGEYAFAVVVLSSRWSDWPCWCGSPATGSAGSSR